MTTSTTTVLAPISVGELIDKITILELKSQRITNPTQLLNVHKELAELTEIWQNLNMNTAAVAAKRVELLQVNGDLWDIENYKRAAEREQRFDQGFLTAARQVYLKNDQRAQIKREINQLTGSSIVEEKSY